MRLKIFFSVAEYNTFMGSANVESRCASVEMRSANEEKGCAKNVFGHLKRGKG
jgi:hypothetical protein